MRIGEQIKQEVLEQGKSRRLRKPVADILARRYEREGEDVVVLPSIVAPTWFNIYHSPTCE